MSPDSRPARSGGNNREMEENAPSVVLSRGMLVFGLFREHKDVESKANTVRLTQVHARLVRS